MSSPHPPPLSSSSSVPSRENDPQRPVHAAAARLGGGSLQEDEPQGEGHPGAGADGERLPHGHGALRARGGEAPEGASGTLAPALDDVIPRVVLQCRSINLTNHPPGGGGIMSSASGV